MLIHGSLINERIVQTHRKHDILAAKRLDAIQRTHFIRPHLPQPVGPLRPELHPRDRLPRSADPPLLHPPPWLHRQNPANRHNVQHGQAPATQILQTNPINRPHKIIPQIARLFLIEQRPLTLLIKIRL